MKFDTVIIGGGLSGLACGIGLSKAGKKCVIISSGQSALHFSSGSFDLLNSLPDGTSVIDPVDSIRSLTVQNISHPYSKIGEESFSALADEAKQLLTESGIHIEGNCRKNRYRMTPFASMKPTWLVMDDFLSCDTQDKLPWKSVAIFNFLGYLDFYPSFIGDELFNHGIKIQKFEIDLASIEEMRRNPSELRSTNIARLLDRSETQNNLVEILKKKAADAELILLPACLGFEKSDVVLKLSKLVGKPIRVIATFPPSVSGIRAQQLLRKRFMDLGGIYMLGDNVNKVEFNGNKVKRIYTVNHVDIPIEGDNYVLCSGSFFSQGLVALPDKVIDPIFGLDVDYLSDRQKWYSPNVYDKQQYQTFGVKTDHRFLGIKAGKIIDNLYACGAVLGGFDALREGCGSGVSLLTALFVAKEILNK